MIVKMKFVNISGPRNDIDRVTDLYLSRYEIQLESALSELKTVDDLRPFMEMNPYRDALNKAVQFVDYLPDSENITPDDSLTLNDMFEVIRNANQSYTGFQEKRNELKKRMDELKK
ncbi:MAG TPA: ATPase, partial [Lachnospiraceae bacterium]|nr:ATPase [Lachnospiraceae bacterium]